MRRAMSNHSTSSLLIPLSAVALLASLTSAVALAQGAPDRSKPPPSGKVEPFAVPVPKELTTKGGVKVQLIERKRAPLVDIIAIVDAGASADPVGKLGLASATAAMLTEGAGDRDAIAFTEAVTALGADLNSWGDLDVARLMLHTTSARLPEAMALFGQALTKPRFDDAEWKRKQREIVGDLLVASQDPMNLAELAVQRALHGTSRAGTAQSGTPHDLLGITADDLRGFYKTRYRPDTTTIVVVGDVDQKTLLALLDKELAGFIGGTPRPELPKVEPGVAIGARDVIVIDVPGAPQTVVRAVGHAPGVQRYTADVDVMNALLGGSFTSRLNSNLREEHGYAYGAGSMTTQTRNTASFLVRTSVATPVTIPALDEVMKELGRIHEPASPDEVDRARNYVGLTFPSDFDNGRGIALLWSSALALGVPPARVQGYLEQALKVDQAALKAAADRVVHADKMRVVVVGDASKWQKELGRFGKVSTLTAAELLPGLDEADKALAAP